MEKSGTAPFYYPTPSPSIYTSRQQSSTGIAPASMELLPTTCSQPLPGPWGQPTMEMSGPSCSGLINVNSCNRMNYSFTDFKTMFYNPFAVKHRKRTTRTQFKVLEETFKSNPKPSSELRKVLAEQLNMSLRGVQVWFQNRRAKEKNNRNHGSTATSGSELGLLDNASSSCIVCPISASLQSSSAAAGDDEKEPTAGSTNSSAVTGLSIGNRKAKLQLPPNIKVAESYEQYLLMSQTRQSQSSLPPGPQQTNADQEGKCTEVDASALYTPLAGFPPHPVSSNVYWSTPGSAGLYYSGYPHSYVGTLSSTFYNMGALSSVSTNPTPPLQQPAPVRRNSCPTEAVNPYFGAATPGTANAGVPVGNPSLAKQSLATINEDDVLNGSAHAAAAAITPATVIPRVQPEQGPLVHLPHYSARRFSEPGSGHC